MFRQHHGLPVDEHKHALQGRNDQPFPVGSGAIYVGTSAAGLQASPVVGMFIAPNTPPQIFTVTDVSLLYVRSVNNSDNVGWIYFN